MSAEKRIFNLLVVCTGSVATIKLRELLSTLLTHAGLSNITINIKVALTDRAKHFLNPEDYLDEVIYLSDENEWSMWKGRGDPVLHIDLAKWADVCLIAPLSANTLAKLSQGICDNLVTCIIRAWEMKKTLILCPAMNTKMWEHPITAAQIGVLKSWGFIEVPPISKTLMCGDTGMGAMAEINTIKDALFQVLNK